MSVTTKKFIEKACAVHGEKYDYSQVVYINSKQKVSIVCPEHGVFEQTPDKHINGPCGCPMCAGNKPGSTLDFVKKAKVVHGELYDYSQVSYVTNKLPVSIVCRTHGAFLQSPTNHLAGKGCPKCANNEVLSREQFIARAQKVHGDRYDYSDVNYVNNRTYVSIRCKRHGLFDQVPSSHLGGCGCPVCGREAQTLHRDEQAIRAKAKTTCLQRYGVINPMFDADIRERQLLAVGSDEAKAKSVATKHKNHSFNISRPERMLGEMLVNYFGADDVFHNYVSDVYPFRCDFYIESRDMYIELNAHWIHGGHWYTDADASTIAKWREKLSESYGVTFSVRDVEKRRVAAEHCLNYVVFWKNDLSDAKLWFDAGCPDGQDWCKEYSWL